MTEQSVEKVLISQSQSIPTVSTSEWVRTYMFDAMESNSDNIEMFDLPSGYVVTACVLYHDIVGDVTLSVGNTTNPTYLIASEDGNYVGTGVLGQGVTNGIGPDAGSQTIVVRFVKNSGAFTSGAYVRLYVQAVRT